MPEWRAHRPILKCDAHECPGGARVGAEGWAPVFSFESKKLMTTLGQGGMVTTDNSALAARLRRLRAYGGRDHWGTNQMMSKIQATVGVVQLSRLDEMNSARIGLAHRRTQALEGIDDLTLPPTLGGEQRLYYRHDLLVPDAWGDDGRHALMNALATTYGVGSIVSDPVTYLGHGLIREHTRDQHCPRAERLAARLLRPVLHPRMSPGDETAICDAIRRAAALLTLWRFRDRAALRASFDGFKEGLRGGQGERSPMSWGTVARLTSAGRPPIL